MLADAVDALSSCLNVMYGFAALVRRQSSLAIHLDVQLCFADAIFRARRQLDGTSQPLDPDMVLADLTIAAGGSGRTVRLRAEDCDVFADSGRVDPLPALRAEDRDVIRDVATLFPDYHAGLQSFSPVAGRDRKEYARYVAKQLRCGKVELRATCRAGGTIFPITKTSGKQRVIWNGEALSAATAAPPKPACLASPSSLLWLEAPEGPPLLAHQEGRRGHV